VTQPTFVPVADSGAVRPCATTAPAQIGRPQKAGLLGAPGVASGRGRGTPGPDAGYALTLAHQMMREIELPEGEDPHDLEEGVAALAAKRASLLGRGPTGSDVAVAMDLFGLRTRADGAITADRRRRFAGIGHDYFARRSFVDSIPEAMLRQAPNEVRALVYYPLRETK
jgi:hypothetical protein